MALETFEGKEVELNSPSYAVFASFSDLTRMKDRIPDEYKDKVTVTPDTVEGDYNGMHLGLKVAERIPNSRVVMKPMEGFPLDFSLIFKIVTGSWQKMILFLLICDMYRFTFSLPDIWFIKEGLPSDVSTGDQALFYTTRESLVSYSPISGNLVVFVEQYPFVSF